MGVGAPVAAGFRNDADGPGFLDPLFWGQGEAVEACLFSKPVEFDGIKTGLIKMLPDA